MQNRGGSGYACATPRGGGYLHTAATGIVGRQVIGMGYRSADGVRNVVRWKAGVSPEGAGLSTPLKTCHIPVTQV